MECEDVLTHLWEYLDEELPPEEAKAVAFHLRWCAECHPAFCCDRALLRLLARQRVSAPVTLYLSVRARLHRT